MPTNMMNLDHAHFTTHLPLGEIKKLSVVGVDRFLLEDAKGDSPMGERALLRVEELLPGSRDLWVKIGSYFEDQTYFSEEENKWEFCHQDDLLFVRREELEGALKQWESECSRPLTHNPFKELSFHKEV